MRYLFMQKTFLFILFSLFSTLLYSQEKEKTKENQNKATLYGIGVYDNFQNKGIAIDARAKIHLFNNFFISPCVSYYPPFNNIHEIYGGGDLDYNLPSYKFLTPYLYLGGYYDDWINSSDFQNPKAKRNSVLLEGGLGVIFNIKCFHPYIEYRYDTDWKEGSIGIGILFNFKCMFNSEGRKIKKCPRF